MYKLKLLVLLIILFLIYPSADFPTMEILYDIENDKVSLLSSDEIKLKKIWKTDSKVFIQFCVNDNTIPMKFGYHGIKINAYYSLDDKNYYECKKCYEFDYTDEEIEEFFNFLNPLYNNLGELRTITGGSMHDYKIVWYSEYDVLKNCKIRLKFVIEDYYKNEFKELKIYSEKFSLNNGEINFPPRIENVKSQKDKKGKWFIEFDLYDPNDDTCSVYVKYSFNDRKSKNMILQ